MVIKIFKARAVPVKPYQTVATQHKTADFDCEPLDLSFLSY